MVPGFRQDARDEPALAGHLQPPLDAKSLDAGEVLGHVRRARVHAGGAGSPGRGQVPTMVWSRRLTIAGLRPGGHTAERVRGSPGGTRGLSAEDKAGRTAIAA
jgi:hypothetical protein